MSRFVQRNPRAIGAAAAIALGLTVTGECGKFVQPVQQPQGQERCGSPINLELPPLGVQTEVSIQEVHDVIFAVQDGIAKPFHKDLLNPSVEGVRTVFKNTRYYKKGEEELLTADISKAVQGATEMRVFVVRDEGTPLRHVLVGQLDTISLMGTSPLSPEEHLALAQTYFSISPQLGIYEKACLVQGRNPTYNPSLLVDFRMNNTGSFQYDIRHNESAQGR